MKELLERAGINQAELARRLGVLPQTVTHWKSKGLPVYAVAYLELLIQYNRVRP